MGQTGICGHGLFKTQMNVNKEMMMMCACVLLCVLMFRLDIGPCCCFLCRLWAHAHLVFVPCLLTAAGMTLPFLGLAADAASIGDDWIWMSA